MDRKLRTLLFSTLYPSSVRPVHGIFVETRLRELLASGQVETRVVAPVPWFPSTDARWGERALMARTPRHERRNGIEVAHPRYPLLPKVGMSTSPFLLAMASLQTLRRLLHEGFDFDLIDAHYYYPDGVAATILGTLLGKPVVITARGTDVNLIPRFRWPRRLIVEAAARCAASITVCSALRDALVDLGASADRITVLRNGVDLTRFKPVDRAQARAALGVGERFAIASVGHLIERKGHDLVIGALAHLHDAEVHIAGAGEQLDALRALAAELGVTDRVTFHGAVPQAALRTLYEAADCLVLASSREGWANVLLEAMACGTPVVASNVWGTPEVVAAPEAGELMDERTAFGVAAAVGRLRGRTVDRRETRRYAERFDWDATTEGQLALFDRVVGRRAVAAEVVA